MSGSVNKVRTTSVMLRPVGTPIPLGFLALMLGTCTLGCLQLGWLPVSQS